MNDPMLQLYLQFHSQIHYLETTQKCSFKRQGIQVFDAEIVSFFPLNDYGCVYVQQLETNGPRYAEVHTLVFGQEDSLLEGKVLL